MNLIAGVPDNKMIGVVSTVLVNHNDNRGGLVITNLSNNTVFLAYGETPAELNKGIVLYSHGSLSFDGFLYAVSAINAIADAPNSLVSFQELNNAT